MASPAGHPILERWNMAKPRLTMGLDGNPKPLSSIVKHERLGPEDLKKARRPVFCVRLDG